MIMTIITNNIALENLCSHLAKQSVIFLDTEFMRHKTYIPKLCLVQISDGQCIWLIDVLSLAEGITPLFDILYDTNITKVLHAGKQDIEIFFHLTKQVPFPIFDTQTAAIFCKMGAELSYEQLVGNVASTVLNKQMQFTNWEQRPLEKAQIEYALDDVRYLPQIYSLLTTKLGELGRLEWMKEEMEYIYNNKTYSYAHERLFKKFSKNKAIKRSTLPLLYSILKWREEEAYMLNIPRTYLLKDEHIIAVLTNRISDISRLNKTTNYKLSKKLLNELWDVVQTTGGHNIPEQVLHFTYDKENPHNLLMLKDLLKQKSLELGMPEYFIADKNILNKLSNNIEVSVTNWRKSIFIDWVRNLNM
jgi:ribonuclease D